MDNTIEEILNFWFGPLTSMGLCAEPRNALWFQSSAEIDAYCTQAFSDHLEKATKGELNQWAETNEGLVALIVLLDQFSRNIHRGSPKAFAGDPVALELAKNAINAGRDEQLPAIYRAFIYMPLEHCEDLQTQEQCVALFDQLAKTVPDEQIESFARFAIAHRDVIAQFGRFPHRNEMLGRSSTPDELEHLQKHGGF